MALFQPESEPIPSLWPMLARVARSLRPYPSSFEVCGSAGQVEEAWVMRVLVSDLWIASRECGELLTSLVRRDDWARGLG
jgi:hypothetical protein